MVEFLRTQFGKYKKLKKKWRKPRGHHNKLRLGIKGKGLKPKIGYKKPNSEKIPRIFSLSDLEKSNYKKIIIASSVGKKKRQLIIDYCKKNNIEIWKN
ncbi:MAG: hypothetical protein B6U88_01470 [Candidatus Aenigmarchaeota archaeon ex4484_56]|nr:MAG: hypothetical protein B6U88_01470 [Candidatus Aenigmarchaeota archaeon ex4484_56]